MKILAPVDGSKYSMDALKVVVDFAKNRQAEIYVINVVQDIEGIDFEISAAEKERLKDRMEKGAEDILQQARRVLAAGNVTAVFKTISGADSVPEAIIEFAEKEKMDLIIIGSRGLSPSSRFRMGSVASRVVRHSHCSVYVVKLPG